MGLEELRNEEMFGAQDPVDPDAPEPQDAEPEPEPEAEPEAEAEPEDAEPQTQVDYAALMQELGLTQFKDPAEAIRAVVAQNRYIGKLEAERAAWRKQTEPATQQPQHKAEFDPDQFIENPDEVLKQRGFVRQEDVQRMVEESRRQAVEEQRIAAFQAAHPDFEDLKGDMAAIYQANEWLDRIPASEAMSILYERAKRTRTAASPQPKPTAQIVPADKDKKDRANTSGGKGVKPSAPRQTGALSMEDAIKMTPEEIEEKLGFTG